jgi:chromosomal replication initiator protein
LQTQLEAENAKKVISIDTIQKVVAEHFDVRLNDILGTKRPKNIAEPRMVAMYLCREMTNSSFPTIGTAFGKNHATIMNAMKKVPELCRKDENFRLTVSRIQRQLQS